MAIAASSNFSSKMTCYYIIYTLTRLGVILALMTSTSTAGDTVVQEIISASLYDRAVIPCSQTGRTVPYWMINGGRPLRQDELPSRCTISGQNLIIYPLMLSDNGSTYQCALPNRVTIGSVKMLIVNATLTDTALRRDYINFEIGEISTNISLKRYSIGSCIKFILEGYQLSYLEEYDLQDPQISRDNPNNSFSVKTQKLMDLYFRVIARDKNDMICSEPASGNFFFHFNESERLVHTIPNGNVYIPIPVSLDICGDGNIAGANLPSVDDDHSCICPLYSANDNTSAECIRNCNATHSVGLDDSGVCFQSVKKNNTLLYYDCNRNLCDSPGSDCFVYFILSSHKIIIDGPPSTPNIFRPNSSYVLCFEAYSSPHHPVMRYDVNVTDNTGSLVLNDSFSDLNDSSIPCIDTSKILDMYGSLNVLISATNKAGTSDTAEENLQKPEVVPLIAILLPSVIPPALLLIVILIVISLIVYKVYSRRHRRRINYENVNGNGKEDRKKINGQ